MKKSAAPVPQVIGFSWGLVLAIAAGIIVAAVVFPMMLGFGAGLFEGLSQRNADLPIQRDDQRQSDVGGILNAVYQYAIDHGGAFPKEITTTPTVLCLSTMRCDGVDIYYLLTNYIASIPRDPIAGKNDSAYTIRLAPGGRIEVSAPHAETRVVSERR